MRLTPPRRARRRIAGLVMPWMLSRRTFLCLLAPPFPSPLPPLPRPLILYRLTVCKANCLLRLARELAPASLPIHTYSEPSTVLKDDGDCHPGELPSQADSQTPAPQADLCEGVPGPVQGRGPGHSPSEDPLLTMYRLPNQPVPYALLTGHQVTTQLKKHFMVCTRYSVSKMERSNQK